MGLRSFCRSPKDYQLFADAFIFARCFGYVVLAGLAWCDCDAQCIAGKQAVRIMDADWTGNLFWRTGISGLSRLTKKAAETAGRSWL